MTSKTYSDARLDALTEADFGTLALLGQTIWLAHYTKIISVEQINYMLAGRYTPQELRKYLASDDRWLDLLSVGSRHVGYCSYARTATAGGMKLEQLYLLQRFQGRGLGGFMLRHVEDRTRGFGLKVLSLQVNKHNVDAIAVYRKAGFTLRAEAVFDIGNGFVMDDYVMQKIL